MGLIYVSLKRIVSHFPLFFVYFWWFKLLSEVAVWYLVRHNYRTRFWFFHNLGLSETALFGGAFTLDILIALVLMYGTYYFLLFL